MLDSCECIDNSSISFSTGSNDMNQRGYTNDFEKLHSKSKE